MFSALKHKGKRLYELAREGIEVEREPRTIHIHELTAKRLSADELELDIRCSKGTYVRTLVDDLGEVLDCGAHVTALRRLGVTPFDDPDMVTIDELKAVAEAEGVPALDRFLLPIDEALGHCPPIQLGADLVFYVKQGHPVLVPGAPQNGNVRLYDGERFLGVGCILDDGRVAPKRLLIG
jgi:tRNA pseudouridine55 synthase